jgi:hypothetical protein
MSNIPKARAIIEGILKTADLDPVVRRQLHAAHMLMTREPAVRRARGAKTKIDRKTRRRVEVLAATDMTMHEIAHATGLRNAGRVSEVLNGKR